MDRGEDLGGGLSLGEGSGAMGGSGVAAAASKSMQVWDKDGQRISSRRLAVSRPCLHPPTCPLMISALC
jgi:NO-binding membrane sensor protein with MHYT domain